MVRFGFFDFTRILQFDTNNNLKILYRSCTYYYVDLCDYCIL